MQSNQLFKNLDVKLQFSTNIKGEFIGIYLAAVAGSKQVILIRSIMKMVYKTAVINCKA